MNKKIIRIFVALLISFFLLVLADFVPFWMPMMGEMTALLAVTVLLIAWAGFVLLETASDEREVYVTSQSGRIAYLAGIIVLTIGLITQGLAHTIDPWLPMALITMVLIKLFARLYLE